MKIKHDSKCVPINEMPYGKLFRGLRRDKQGEWVEVFGVRAYRLGNNQQQSTFVEILPRPFREWRDGAACSDYVLDVDSRFRVVWEPAFPETLIPGNRDFGQVFITFGGKFVSIDAPAGMEYLNLEGGRILDKLGNDGFWVKQCGLEEIPELPMIKIRGAE